MNREEYLLKYNKLLQRGVQINYNPNKLTLEELEYNYKILIYRLERKYVERSREQLKQILLSILPSSSFSEEYIDNILEKYIKMNYN